MITSSVSVFACLSKVCAPPPAGKGGSLPSTGGAVPAHDLQKTVTSSGREGLLVFVKPVARGESETSTKAVFGDQVTFAVGAKIEANNAVASRLAQDHEFRSWVSKVRDSSLVDNEGMIRVANYFKAKSANFMDTLDEIVRERDRTIPSGVRTFFVAKGGELAEAFRRMHGEADKYRSMSDEDVLAHMVGRVIIDSWARSSTHHESYSSQMAASSVHKTPATSLKSFDRDAFKAWSKKSSDTIPQWLHEAVIRAEYDATQQFFKDRGIKRLVLYRGMTGVAEGVVPSDTVKVKSFPLSSWSTQRNMAARFAAFSKGSVVLAMEVPVSMVQSTPFTGRGCLGEYEVVLINKTSTALVETVRGWAMGD